MPPKPKERKISNTTLKDPEWYVAIAADALDLKFGTLAKTLGKALKPEVDDVAKELVGMYVVAFNATLEAQHLDPRVKAEKGSKKYFSDNILDPNFPSHHPVYQQLVGSLRDALTSGDADELVEGWADLGRTIRQEFSINFNSIVQAGSSEYSNAIDYIGQLKSYAEPVESQVIAHMNTVLHEVEYEALAIDPELTLRKSYVTPSCELTFEKMSNFGGSNGEAINERSLLQTLIKKIDISRDPIIIHGQPGHGKTSSVKMLVSALSQLYQFNEKPISVLFYEFKNLRALNDPVLKVLGSETSFVESESFFHGRHTTLILDGLDERQIADGSDESLKGFVSGLFRLAGQVNGRSDGSKLNLILTGRSQFVGQIKSCFSSDHWVLEIDDFSEGNVAAWLERFGEQKNGVEKVTVEQLNGFHLQDLISQPILLTISAIMLCDQDGKRLLGELDGATMNRSQIYKTIIRWSYDKRWQRSPAASPIRDELDFDDYFVLLQAIAFEMFSSGEESIKLSTLSAKLKETFFDLDFLKNKDAGCVENLCSQLRISFFFKGVEDKAFSFIHKSIKDFLIVTGLVDSFLVLLEECSVRKPEKQSEELYRMFGAAELSFEDHVPILNEWLLYRFDDLSVYNEKLLVIWEKVGFQNFPLPSFVETPIQVIECQRKFVRNYYRVISQHFSRSSIDENLRLFGFEQVVLFGRTKSVKFVGFSFFSRFLWRLDGFCFKNQLFRHDWISRVEYLRCDFSGAVFDMLAVQQCNFVACDFEFAIFDVEAVSEATFSGCDLSKSKLKLSRVEWGKEMFASKYSYRVRFLKCNVECMALDDTGKINDLPVLIFVDCNLKTSNVELSDHDVVGNGDNFRLFAQNNSKS